MKISIKPVVRPVELGEYAPEYEGVTLWMWVNPPRALRLEVAGVAQEFRQEKAKLDALLEKPEGERDLDEDAIEKWLDKVTALGARLYAFWAEVWSQGPDAEMHWTVEEVREFAETCQEMEPGLWEYVQERSFDAASEYRDWRKKA